MFTLLNYEIIRISIPKLNLEKLARIHFWMESEVGYFNTVQHIVKTAQNGIFHYLHGSSIIFDYNWLDKQLYVVAKDQNLIWIRY